MFRSYDELVWEALWREKRGDGEPLFQTGMIESVGESEWRIHDEVHRMAEEYAHRLLPEEREDAHQWFERMTASPALETIYQGYRRGLAEPSPIEVIREERRSTLLREYAPLHKRLWGRLMGWLRASSEWPIFECFAYQLAAHHYALAYRTQSEKQRGFNRAVVLFKLSIALILLTLLNYALIPPALSTAVTRLLVPVLAVTLVAALIALTRGLDIESVFRFQPLEQLTTQNVR